MPLGTSIDELKPLTVFMRLLENPDEIKALLKDVKATISSYSKIMEVYPTVEAANARMNEVNAIAEKNQATFRAELDRLTADRAAFETQRQQRDAKCAEREVAVGQRERAVVESEADMKQAQDSYEKMLKDFSARERDLEDKMARREEDLQRRVAALNAAVASV